MLANHDSCLAAVQHRHFEIHQDKLVCRSILFKALLYHIKGLFAVVCLIAFNLVLLEKAHGRDQAESVVVDDKNLVVKLVACIRVY